MSDQGMREMTVKTHIAKNPPEIKNNELPMLLDEKTAAKLLGVMTSIGNSMTR